MKWIAHSEEAWLNLFSSKLRSLLALLGILVGTASVVAMVLGGELATHEALKQFKSLGTDLFAVTISESENTEHRGEAQADLTVPQIMGLSTADNSILSIAPYTQIYHSMQFDGHDMNGGILGVTEEFAKIVHIEMEAGRFISNLDGYTFFCVIGHGLYEDMKKFNVTDPIGKQFQIGNHIFTIAGVAKAWPENNFIYANMDRSVMVSVQAVTVLSKYSAINNIIMRLAPNANIDQVKVNVENYLHGFSEHKRFFFRSAKELINRMAKQSEILTAFLAMIGGVSLIVGGIGVMNIMLVSVVERRREIGIRLAVGATRSDIRALFLVEAVMLSMVGGVLGVIIGIAIAYIIALFSHWQFTLFLLPPFIGFTVSAATGIFFGFYPAHKASQLDPIQALKSE